MSVARLVRPQSPRRPTGASTQHSTRLVRLSCSTPLRDLAPAFRDLPNLAVLEGRWDPRGSARRSHLTAGPRRVIRWPQDAPTADGRDGNADGFAALSACIDPTAKDAADGRPPFAGAVVGYVAYDAAYALERLPGRCPGPAPAGYLWAGVYDWVISRDDDSGDTWLAVTDRDGRDPDEVVAQVTARVRKAAPSSGPYGLGRPRSNLSRRAFSGQVARIHDYIAAGDCYQVNLSRRISFDCAMDGRDVYRLIAHRHPAPFSAFLESDGLEIASVSPELFVSVHQGRARTRPIKGTRPRGASDGEDERLAEALRHSAKDRAENVMIVDVLRNDLGRVCRPGSIRVPQLWATEPHPTVWQLVSEVEGQLRDNVDAPAVLRACSPGGSVTGAPKIRATQIIDELEPVRRGVYCGSVFLLGYDGSLVSSVAIRTLQIEGSSAHLHVGSGIVADSDPELEYEETQHKARGILEALGLRE